MTEILMFWEKIKGVMTRGAVRDSEHRGEESENDVKDMENVALIGAAYDNVQRYGAAAKEHVVAYSGIDNEAGKELKKSLKEISGFKINEKYRDANIKQQSGFSAEIKESTRENAERIVSGDKARASRTDDIAKRHDPHYGNMGGTNDSLYDIAVTDRDGRVIDAYQMKFVGSDPKDTLAKLASRKYEKYLDNNVDIQIPSDLYDGVKREIPAKIDELRQEAQALQVRGKHGQAQKKLDDIEKYKKLDKSLRKSRVSSQEAIEARLNPMRSTIKDVAGIGHRAGIEQAKTGAAIGGGVSIIKNLVSVSRGEKKFDDAALDVVKDTTGAAVVSYATGFTGTVVKGMMQNSSKNTLRGLSKSNLPAAFALSAFEAGKTFHKYLKGEINGAECLEELGEKGTAMTSSAMFAAIGQTAIPIPMVGAMVGSMVGYTLSSAFYKELADSLKEANLARERRLKIEAECQQAILMLHEFRAEAEKMVSRYLADHIDTFSEAFNTMNASLRSENADEFISGANMITLKLGGTAQFNTAVEFDELMQSSAPLKL